MAKRPDSEEVAAEKAKATRDYHAAQVAAVGRIAALRAARLARDAQSEPGSEIKKKTESAAKGEAKRAIKAPKRPK